MKKIATLLFLCLFLTVPVAMAEGTKQGASDTHLLNPFVATFLKTLGGQDLVIRTDSAVSAIEAAYHTTNAVIEGVVSGIKAYEAAMKQVQDAEVDNQVKLHDADPAKLPHGDEHFDAAVVKIAGEAGAFVNELARTLKEGGQALVTTPASWGILFTSGERPKSDVLAEIKSLLTTVDPKDTDSVVSNLSKLTDVLGATFVERDAKLTLVTTESSLVPGEQVWRKTAAGVEQVIYNSEKAVKEAITAAGLEITGEQQAKFDNEQERADYNAVSGQKHGKAYTNHHDSVAITVKKPAHPAKPAHPTHPNNPVHPTPNHPTKPTHKHHKTAKPHHAVEAEATADAETTSDSETDSGSDKEIEKRDEL